MGSLLRFKCYKKSEGGVASGSDARGLGSAWGGCICRSNQDEIREIHTMVKIFEDMVVYLNDYYCYLWKQPKRTMKPRDVLDHI